jgi:hypothetical protein
VTVLAASIKSRWSEFASLSDATVTAAIEEAGRRVSSTAWGDLADDGVRYLAAHILAQDLAGSAAAPGPLVSRSLDGASANYAVKDAGSTETGGTPYGRRFQELHSLIFATRVF